MKILKKIFSILLIMSIVLGFNLPNVYADSIFTRNSSRHILIVNTSTNRLGYFKDKKLVKEFKIASGKSTTQTPTGKTKIVNKIKNRPYYSGGIPGGDPGNPLGDRWLGLNLRGTYGTTYAIHGNNNPNSIGQFVSAGCIRMYNNEVRWLFDQVPVGTTVIIEKSNKSFVEIAKKYNINLESKDDFKTLTNDIYKYDAGKGKHLTYINGKGYSQYSYVNKNESYAFTPSSWMEAAGLDVTMPTNSNGYTMKVKNPYIAKVKELEDVLKKAESGKMTAAEINAILKQYPKAPQVIENNNTPKIPYSKSLVTDINKYNKGKGNHLTYVNNKAYSQYSYLNKSGKYAFTPSSWMEASGLKVTKPSKNNGYIMQINNPYMSKYNQILDKIKNYI